MTRPQAIEQAKADALLQKVPMAIYLMTSSRYTGRPGRKGDLHIQSAHIPGPGKGWQLVCVVSTRGDVRPEGAWR